MASQRFLLGLILGLSAAGHAAAQADGALRWRGGNPALGLRAGSTEFRVPCGSIAFPCDGGGSSLPLYASDKVARSVEMQVGYVPGAAALRLAQPQGLNVSLLGKAGIAPALGVYGRVGTTLGRAAPGFHGSAGPEGGNLSYGVGISWDFSRRGSAVLGWDTYDFRSVGGESRDVRATSIGLQWRY